MGGGGGARGGFLGLGLGAEDPFFWETASEAFFGPVSGADLSFFAAGSLADEVEGLLTETDGTGRGLERGADFENPAVDTFFFTGAGAGSFEPAAVVVAVAVVDAPPAAAGLLTGDGRGGLPPLAPAVVPGSFSFPAPCSLVALLICLASEALAEEGGGGFNADLFNPSGSSSAFPVLGAEVEALAVAGTGTGSVSLGLGAGSFGVEELLPLLGGGRGFEEAEGVGPLLLGEAEAAPLPPAALALALSVAGVQAVEGGRLAGGGMRLELVGLRPPLLPGVASPAFSGRGGGGGGMRTEASKGEGMGEVRYFD